jgi:GT2 family glycosyltransferase
MNPEGAPHVALAIVGYRNIDDVVNCLAALALSSYRDFEVVICENGGAAAAAALAAAVPSTLDGGQTVRVVAAPGNLGFAGGVNVCLREAADADAWWILNPDTVPRSDALKAMVDRLLIGDCDAVGCTLYRPDGRVQSNGGRWRAWLARAESMGNGVGINAVVDAAAIERGQSYLNGASMLVGRRFLEATGPMREDYFLYCEEVEWCLRASAAGMRLGFAPTAFVEHKQGATTGAGAAIRARPRLPIYLDERNKILLTWDCFPGRIAVAAPAALVLLFLRYLPHRAWRQLGYGIAGWWAGLGGRRGVPSWLGVG